MYELNVCKSQQILVKLKSKNVFIGKIDFSILDMKMVTKTKTPVHP